MEAYAILKWLHIVGAATLFGVGVGTAFHFLIAARSANVTAIASAAHAMVLADFIFILPAGVLQPATGVAMALLSGYPLHSRWIVASALLMPSAPPPRPKSSPNHRSTAPCAMRSARCAGS